MEVVYGTYNFPYFLFQVKLFKTRFACKLNFGFYNYYTNLSAIRKSKNKSIPKQFMYMHIRVQIEKKQLSFCK